MVRGGGDSDSDDRGGKDAKKSGKRLTRKMIGDNLSVLARSGDGFGEIIFYKSNFLHLKSKKTTKIKMKNLY